jgi:hypothetical protein
MTPKRKERHSASTTPSSKENALDRPTRMHENAMAKLAEAQYHLGKMKELDGSPQLPIASEFNNLLSAFVSAARTAVDIFRGKRSKPWIPDLLANDIPAKQLFDLFEAMRGESQHVKPLETSAQVKRMPLEQLPPRHRERELRGRVSMPRLPGTAPTEYDVARYTIQVGETEYPAIEYCEKYLSLAQFLIDRRTADLAP